MNGTRTTPEGLKRAAEMAQKHGTKTSLPGDTTGLGEYSDAQLVKELVDRGITDKVIGTNDPITNEIKVHTPWLALENRHRNELRGYQHKRIKEILGEKGKHPYFTVERIESDE